MQAGAILRRFLPPVLFALWAVKFFVQLRFYAVPAFGPVETHLAERSAFIATQLSLGATVACLWLASWLFSFPRRDARHGRSLTADRRREEPRVMDDL